MNKILRRMMIISVLIIIFCAILPAYANNGAQKKNKEEQKEKVVELDSNHSPVPSSEDAKNEIKKEDQSEYEKEIIQVPIEAPASVTGEKYQGSGTVIDFTSTGSKAFYTIQAKDKSVYYLIIDLDKTENNVYFLSEINGEELSLKEVTTENRPQGISTQIFPQQMTSQPNESKSGGWFYILVLLGSAGFVVWYYLKKIKPKQATKNAMSNADEELYYDEDFYDEEYEEFGDNEE